MSIETASSRASLSHWFATTRSKSAESIKQKIIKPLVKSKSTSTSSTIHPPLSHPSEIRLLRLYPANKSSDPLVGRLVVANLDQDHTYDALSYTYSSAFESQTVEDDALHMLEGQQLPVKGNLAQALRRIRSKTEVVPLFVDSICIDHEDIEEVNAQAQLTRRVFQTAQRVVAWLGEDSNFEEGEYVFTFCRAFEYARLGEASEEEVQEFITQYRKQWLKKKKRDTRGLLCHFVSRRYFRRRWVVQELCGAAEVDVRCGVHVLPWHTFLAGIEALRGGSQSVQNCQRETRTILDGPVHVARALGQTTGKPSQILEMLCQSRDLSCLDDKDRVFALASLWDLPGFRVDYRMSVDTVYRQLAKALVSEAARRNDGSAICKMLAISAYQAKHRKGVCDPRTLPTWAPDWRSRAPSGTDVRQCGHSAQTSLVDGKALKLTTRTFGMIDAMNRTGGTMQVIRHKSLNEKELKATVTNRRSAQTALNTFKRLGVQVTEKESLGLEDGDMLCYPVVWDEVEKTEMATVLRPGIEGHVIKCQVAGQFPLKVLGDSPETSTDMELIIL